LKNSLPFLNIEFFLKNSVDCLNEIFFDLVGLFLVERGDTGDLVLFFKLK
jgi:hypothetical protein